MFGGKSPASLVSPGLEDAPLVVTVALYKAKQGEIDAIVALHEDWRRQWATGFPGLLSIELLQDLRDPHIFLRIARFQDQASSLGLAAHPEQRAWSIRLASLSAETPSSAEYMTFEEA